MAWAVRRESTESTEMPLACIGWASAMAHSRPSTKDTNQPAKSTVLPLMGGLRAEESGRKGLGGGVKFAGRVEYLNSLARYKRAVFWTARVWVASSGRVCVPSAVCDV